jgi:CubicO group peptidase (beta-lactamase class C family)
MLKLGQLVLNKGKWGGEQIFNEKFIKEMTKSHIRILNTHKFIWLDYGYSWWIRDFKINNKTYHAIAARGDGGQLIAIIKDLNLIVVKTASNYDHDDFNDLFLEKYIIPAFAK